MKKPLYLIDGYALIFRAYFAVIRNPLINSDGFNVSAIHGFIRMLLKILKDYKPEYLAVSLDSRTPTFRDELYPEYKQTRNKTPEDLRRQFPIIEQFLLQLHLPTIRHNGVEADDIIGSLARRCSQEERDCFIVSGDKDLYQLVNSNIHILKPLMHGSGFECLNEEEVFRDKGVRPDQIVDYLSLLGDSSDNIPGVRGIGQKTAEKLLAEFDTLDDIYANINSVSNANWRDKLKMGEESARLSKSLIILKTDIPFDFAIEDLNLKSLHGSRAATLLEQYQLRTLSADLKNWQGKTPGENSPFYGMGEIDGPEVDPGGGGFVEDRPEPSPAESAMAPLLHSLKAAEQKYELVRTANELQDWIDRCRKAGTYAFDTETDNLDPLRAHLVGFSLSHSPGCACYVPLRSPETQTGKGHLDERTAIALLKPFLEDASVKLVGHNIKYDYKVMASHGIKMANPWFDTLIASWLIDSTQNAYSMDAVAVQYLDYSPQKLLPLYAEILGKKITSNEPIDFSLIPLDKALFYAAEDADITLRLWQVFEKKLALMAAESEKSPEKSSAKPPEKSIDELFFQIEMPLIPILAKMELEGILVNTDELNIYSRELEQSLKKIEQEIYTICGHEFNIASTKQLQTVLFTERMLKPGKKTKTGYSTDTSVLEDLAREDRVAELVLQYRLLAKLKSTYVDTLPTLVNPQSRRIHSKFQQNGTATGRISSHDPNLQNIPIKDEEGRRIRAAFIPKEGHCFISADYSQIELVVLAHLSGDKELLKAFQEGIDVHALTGSLIFQVKPEEVSPLQRRIAKTINFGVMYGMSAFRLSREIGISMHEAKQFIEAYFNTYSGIQSFIQSTIRQTEECGYVETILGRRRHIPAINSSNKHEKMGAERVAVNTPIQGSAADIVKQAMIQISAALHTATLKTRMLLQVHDELIFEVPTGEIEQIKKLLTEIMPHALKLTAPLRVNIEIGNSWGEMH